jgi:epoxyqueuosine reductase
MLTKDDIIDHAYQIGFEDIGFTTAEPFDSQREILNARREEYAWAIQAGLDIVSGTDPKHIFPDAQSIIVLVYSYFRKAFPSSIEGNFGRAYLDDDRITKDGVAQQVKAFRGFLRDNGIDSKVPFNLPHRLTAARAGLGTFGKNNFFYSDKIARKSSWVIPIPIAVNHAFTPDEPTVRIGCPDWCQNACIAACPTRALYSPNRIDPRKCISYLSYYGEGITPMEMREPMGMWVYGCDRCQNVCPRNQPWLAQKLPVNEKVAAREKDFYLPSLLHMDKEFFEARIWPHMFYMSSNDIWRWKMNVARVMGNSLDTKYVPDLVQAIKENEDERIRAMSAWALGRIGDSSARTALDEFLTVSDGIVRDEIVLALESF